MKTTVINCSRCGHNHINLEVYPLTNPIELPNVNGRKINYWGMCPKLCEPILVVIIEEV